MDQETEDEEIKPLIFNYIFHIALFIIYLALHIIIYSKLFWIHNSLGVIFQIGTYFNIIYFIFPIYPFIIILKRKYKKKIITTLKIMTLIFLIIAITFGLIISLVFIINSIKSNTFCKECPFNLNLEHLNEVFGSYYGLGKKDSSLKNKCNSRRCVLYQENQEEQYPYFYLCNYDPSDEFDEGTFTRQNENGEEITADKLLTCLSISPNYNLIRFPQSEFYSYLDLCFFYADFYRCKRFNKPDKHYNLDLDTECPDSNYLLLIYILCILVVILDIIIAILPWGIEYITFKKILLLLSVTRRKANSNNSTAKSSEISQDEESYKKEITPVIIVERENEINDFVLNTHINDNNEVLRLKNNKIKINNIDFKELSEDEKDIYKPPHINGQQGSERNKLNTINNGLEIKVNDSNINIINDNDRQNRKQIINQHMQSTTLISNQIRSLEIKIDNKNSEN
jgi:hypothetical protein